MEKINISLKCASCKSADFEYNDDKTYIKCNFCNREYIGGYDELVDLNQNEIDNALKIKKKEIEKDVMRELSKLPKNIKIKL